MENSWRGCEGDDPNITKEWPGWAGSPRVAWPGRWPLTINWALASISSKYIYKFQREGLFSTLSIVYFNPVGIYDDITDPVSAMYHSDVDFSSKKDYYTSHTNRDAAYLQAERP